MNRCDKLTILIVDDQDEVLDIYRSILGDQLGHRVECVSTPSLALRQAKQTLFDIAIVDAKITYRGASLGGLILAGEIATILGTGSILLMSQYDVREEVRRCDADFTFLPKPRDIATIDAWIQKELMQRIRDMVGRQFGFVAMPFSNPTANEWYRNRLAPWMKEAGLDIKRMDEIPHTRMINVELLERIKQAHFIVFYASTNNANVFFEAGYAYAHNKYIVLLIPKGEELPFDLRSNYFITVDYADDLRTRDDLLRLMAGLRGQ